MRQLRIAWIRGHHGLQPLVSCRRGNRRQESAQPSGKVTRQQHTPHHVCLGQTRGEEILPGRLIRQRTILVAQKKVSDFRRHESGEFIVLLGASVIQHQAEGKCGLVMLPDPHRIRKLRQPMFQPFLCRLLQRTQVISHLLGLRLSPLAQFCDQLKEPS